MLARPRYIGAGALEGGDRIIFGSAVVGTVGRRVVAMRWLAQRSWKALSS